MGITIGHIAWMIRWRVDFSALLLIAFVFQLAWPIVVFAAPDLPNEYEEALRNSICQVVVEQSDQTPTDDSLDAFVCDWCVTSHTSFDVFDLSVIQIEYPHQSIIRGIKPFIENEVGLEIVATLTAGPRAPPVL